MPLFPTPAGSPQTEYGPAHLVRWTMDLDGNTDAIVEQKISDLPGEFPRLDERFSGLAYRHGYYAGLSNELEANAGFDVLVHVDLDGGP